MDILEFFSREAGQRRRRALDAASARAGRYIPPNLRPLSSFLADMTPTASLERAGQSSERMLDPSRTPTQRVGDLGAMLSDTAGVAAPALVAGRAAMPAAQAVQEALLGVSVPARAAGDAVVRRANQRGPMPTTYSNPVMSVAEMRRQANIDRFGYDPNEAPVQQAGSGLLSDYVGQHRAPMRDDGAPAFDLAGDIYPDDIYSSKAVQYYGTGSEAMDKNTMGLLQSLRGKPDADVTIYRAVPKGVDNLNAGDWVTVSKQYAKDHGESALGGNFDIIEKKVKAKDIFTNGDSIHEFGYDPSTPAQEVAGLLSSGRADEVTDEMLAKFTPNDEMEIFDLYQRGATGMDLPMDEASRMARKREMAHGRDLFHGGKGGYNYLSADAGTGKTTGTGAFVSPSNLLAETYSPVVDGAVYPVSSRSSAPIVSADMQNWNNIEAPVYAYDPRSMEDIEIIGESGRASTDDIAREARGMLDAVEIQDVSDRGPRVWGTTQYPPISDVRVEYDPSNIRSRFARFDPRLAHLRNLSAGVGGLGLLGASQYQQNQQNRGLLQ